MSTNKKRSLIYFVGIKCITVCICESIECVKRRPVRIYQNDSTPNFYFTTSFTLLSFALEVIANMGDSGVPP